MPGVLTGRGCCLEPRLLHVCRSCTKVQTLESALHLQIHYGMNLGKMECTLGSHCRALGHEELCVKHLV